MSTATAAVSPSQAGHAAKAMAQADQGMGKWLQDLVTGEGSSPAHIIITGVIGVVPGLGQAFDVRDLILGVIAITRSPANPLVWVDVLITLIGFVPAAGDAFKVCFKMVRHGHGFGRVVDALRGVLKGDVDKWLRSIDWGMLAGRAKTTFNDALGVFISSLDSWVVKAAAGRGNVNMMIGELKGIQKVAPKYLDDALDELKKMHAKILDDIAPASTAAKSTPTGSRAAANAADAKAAPPPKPAERKSGSTTRKSDQTPDNQGMADTRKHDQPREAQKKKDNWRSGVLPEHITDYHIAKRHANFKKINDHGKKVEEHNSPRGAGIDHVWKNGNASIQVFESSGGKGGKPYVIGETKGSLLGAFAFLSALPPDLRDHFDALRADETAGGDNPNAFGNEQRDNAPAKKAEITTDQGIQKGRDADGKWQQGLNTANEETGLPTQMSHEWIARNLANNGTLIGDESRILRQLIRDFREAEIACPYHRWVFMVTGRQKYRHETSKKTSPHLHEIQRPIVTLPDDRTFLWR